MRLLQALWPRCGACHWHQSPTSADPHPWYQLKKERKKERPGVGILLRRPIKGKSEPEESKHPRGATLPLRTVTKLQLPLFCQAHFKTCPLPRPRWRPFRLLRTYSSFRCHPHWLVRCPVQGVNLPWDPSSSLHQCSTNPCHRGCPSALV